MDGGIGRFGNMTKWFQIHLDEWIGMKSQEYFDKEAGYLFLFYFVMVYRKEICPAGHYVVLQTIIKHSAVQLSTEDWPIH